MKSKHASGKGHTEDMSNQVKQSLNSVTSVTPSAKSCRGDPTEPGRGARVSRSHSNYDALRPGRGKPLCLHAGSLQRAGGHREEETILERSRQDKENAFKHTHSFPGFKPRKQRQRKPRRVRTLRDFQLPTYMPALPSVNLQSVERPKHEKGSIPLYRPTVPKSWAKYTCC